MAAKLKKSLSRRTSAAPKAGLPAGQAGFSRLLSIGQAAQFLGVSIDTLRNWEEKGKLIPLKRVGGNRRYSLSQLKKIQQTKEFSLLPGSAPEVVTITSYQTGLTLPKYIKVISISLASTLVFLFILTTLITTGYLLKPQETKQLLANKIQPTDYSKTQEEQVLGTSVSPSMLDTLYSIPATVLSPFNSLAQTVIQAIKPDTARDLGFYQKTTDQRFNQNEQAVLDLNGKINQLKDKIASTPPPNLPIQGSLSNNIKRLVLEDAFIGEAIIDTGGIVYPTASFKGSLGTSSRLFGGLYTSQANILGSVVLGNTSSDTVKIIGRLNNDLIPSGNGDQSLGDGDHYFKKGYINTITSDIGGFTSLSVGANFTSAASTVNLINTNATTLNIGGAATAVNIGASSGTTTINNNLSVTGSTTLGNTVTLAAGKSIVPATTGSSDLGSSTYKFNNLYSNTINTATINSSGQGIFTYAPTSSAISEGSVYINPTTATAARPLLSLAVGGTEKARLTTDGYLGLNGANDPGSTYIINGGANFNVSTAGAVVAVGINSGSGLIQGTGGITVTGTGNINATGTSATNIGNSTGALTLASGGTSAWTNTSGNLTISTATSGTMAVDSVGALNLGTTNSTSTALGKAATTLTVNSTSWTATPTISGLITATSGLTSNGAVTVQNNSNLSLSSGTGTFTQTYSANTGTAATVTLSGTAPTSASGLSVSQSPTVTTTVANSGNLLSLSRSLTTNTGGALTTTGAVASLASNCTQTAGTCTDSANVLSLTQSYTSASGAVLAFSNSGAGVDILGTSSTWQVTKAGAATFVGVNSGSGLIQGTGGLTVTGTTNINATGTSATNIGNSTGALTVNSGGTSAWTNTSGNLSLTTATSGDITLTAAGNIALTGATGTTYTIGATGTTGTTTIGQSTASNIIAIGNANSTGTQTINLGAGTPTGSGKAVITIGNSTLASSLDLKAGTGNFTLDGAATTTLTLGSSLTSGAITIGGTSRTGTLTLGQSTAGETINIGNGNVASGNTNNINIGATATSTGKDVITIGNTTAASSLSLQAGSGGATLNATSGNTTVSTTTSGTLALTSAGALNLTGAAASTWSVTSGGLTVNSTSANLALQTTTSGNITLAPASTGSVAITSGTTTGTGSSSGLSIAANSLQSGTALDITSTSTAGTASGSDILLNLSRSGTNSNTAHTAYGLYSSVTNTNVTSGTNIAGYFSASGATTANYGLIVANGNVGIGTTSPTQKLSVSGNVDTTGNLAVGTTLGTWGSSLKAIQFPTTSIFDDGGITLALSGNLRNNGTNNIYLTTQTAAQLQIAGGFYFFTAPSGTAGNAATLTERMRIDNSGNVGIGITSPAEPLHVLANTNAFRGLRVENSSNGSSAASYLILVGDSGNGQIFQNSSTNTAYGGAKSLNFYSSNGNLAFMSNGASSAQMIINNGNVGIGITAPAATLDILTAAASTGINLAGTAPASVAGNGTNAATNTLAVVGTAGGASSGVTGQTGGTGGALSLTSGIGGAVAGASGIGGVGGGLTLAGGAGGAGAATGGAGGAISITTGNAGTGGNANAGTLTLTTGTVTGSGTATINLGTTNATAINIGRNGSALTLASNGTSAWTNTSGNLTLSTATSGTLALTSAGALNLTGAAASTWSVTSGGLTINSTSANLALQTTTSGNITLAPASTGSVTITSGTTTGTGTSSGLSVAANSLQSGTALDITSTSTAGTASGSDTLLNLSRSGLNSNTAHTAYGLYSSVTNTNVTSGTNIAGYFSASGATTANYGLIVANGNVGIGTTGPGQKLYISGGDIGMDNGGWGTFRDKNGEMAIAYLASTGSDNGYILLGSKGATTNNRYSSIQFATMNTEKMRIDSAGNVGIGTTAPGALLDLGTAGTTLGVIRLAGNTSGNVIIQPAATAGTWTFTLPATGGTSGYALTTNGSGTSSWNILTLAGGGTSAALTASNGGIFYSTSTAGAILAGTATAGQLLLSGATAAPTWSTTTYPTTNAVSTLLYASSANVMAALATANSGVLVTSSTGVPSILGSMTNGQLVVGSTGATPVLATLTGTANQITVTNGAGTITLSTPQDIATTSTPQFARLGLGAAADATNILTTTSTSTINLSKALNVSHTGAITGTGYAGYFSKTGTSTTNIGLYSTASGATNNYAAIFEAGNVGIGITAPAATLDILTAAASTGFNLAGTAPASVSGNGTSAATNTLLVVGTAGGASSGITGQTGGTGGALTFTAGVGGAVAGASGIGGVGGGLTLAGGAGGAGAATGGAGGAISITTGNAGTGGNANAGTLTLTTGTVTGSGTATINLGTTNATAINIGRNGSALTLASNGTSAWTNTSGNLTLSTATSGTLALTSAGALNLTGAAASTWSVTSGGLTVNSTSANLALQTTTSGNITLAPASTGSVTITSGTTTGTGTSSGLSVAANSLQSGTALDITSTSTAGTASGSDTLLNLSRSGTNSNTAHTAYGLYSSVTNTNVTSGTNIAGYFSASGATTANYGLIVANGNVGIGTTNPSAMLSVGSTSQFQVNSSGAIAAATGITSSGAITLSSLSTNGIVTNTAAGVLGTLAGTATTVLHGNAAGLPTYSAVSLTTDVSGILPIANGGTNNSAYTTGSIIFFNGTSLTQDNSNLFWDSTNHRLGIGTAGPGFPLEIRGVSGTNFIQLTRTADPTQWFGIDAGAGRVIFNNVAATLYPSYSFNSTNGATTVTQMTIDGSGNVGIGTTNLPYKLRVVLSNNDALLGYLTVGEAGSEYPSVGYNVKYDTVSTGTYTYLGADYASMIRFNSGKVETLTAASGTAGNSITFTTGPYVAQGGTTWTAGSDVRLKTNIQNLSVLDKLQNYRAVSFDWRQTGIHDVGTIAQELYNVFPEAVVKGSNGTDPINSTDPGVWGVQYEKLGPIALEGVKELNSKVDIIKTDQQSQINSLQTNQATTSAALTTVQNKLANLSLDNNGNLTQTGGFNVTGNVGIGTTTPTAKLQITGNSGNLLSINNSTANILTITSGGNIGIGTTSPAGALHVVGQCVAKGTRIRRRRRKSSSDGGDEGDSSEVDWEDIPVEDIKPGDEVLSLNDHTGKWEWHRVEKTLDKGIQTVYRLQTETGKWIETTSEHPYLVKLENFHQKTALADGFPISSLTRFVNNTELTLRTNTTLSQLSSIVKSENSVDPTGIEPVRPIFLGSAPKPGGPTQGLLSQNPNLFSIKWIKVSGLKKGMEIATSDGWEKIVSIKKAGRKQTYDLQIEGTHNFVGNDIVAHNTTIFQGGNVGIGTTNPQFTLEINGTGKLNDAGWTYASDRRLKENIASVSAGLSVIKQLNPVTFDYINGGKNRVGFIAQEVQTVLPNLVTTGSDGMLGLRTEEILPYTVKAIQEQQTQINSLIAQQATNSALLAGLSVNTDGTLNAPEIKTGKLVLSADVNFATTKLAALLTTTGGTGITSAMGGGYNIDVLSSLDSISTAVLGVQTQESSTSAQLADLQTTIATQSATLANLKSAVASQSATTLTLAQQLASAAAELAQTKSDVNNLKLTPPDLLLSTSSATLANLSVVSEASVSGKLTAYSAAISDTFKSLGNTFLGNTTVAGDLSVDGTLSITGSSLSALSTLYIQNGPLATLVDFFNGLVTIDKTGLLTIQKLSVSSKTLSTATIRAGANQILVSTNQLTPTSKIFLSPHKPLPVAVTRQDLVAQTFTIELQQAQIQDLDVDWWIVDSK